jgi:23S rRNA (guanosine2251-2'-O)-methyltransferase
VLELLRAGHGVERVLIAEGVRFTGAIGEIRRRARDAGIPVRVVPRAEVDRSSEGTNHQGVVAFAARFRYAPLERLLAVPSPALLFLDGIMDPHNLGSLLRSADGAGFSGVVLPARRAAGITAAVRRVAAGAAEVVPVARVSSLPTAIDDARAAGLWMVGLDAGAEQDIWSSELLEPPVGLVLGSEDKGISRGVRARCDAIAGIPLGGRLSSVNVAVAGAVAMFEVARRRAHSDTL